MRVAIASRIHPNSLGGLAAYQRLLATDLQNTSRINTRFLSVAPHCGDKVDTGPLECSTFNLMSNSTWKRQHKFVSHFASRRALMPLIGILSRTINFQTDWKSAIADVDALHFVGTGWDVIGFPLCHAARSAGVPFTIWPAVHPQSWGDDAIDIRLYQQADAVFCQSEHEKAHLAKLGVPTEKLIRCGLPPMCQTNGTGVRLRSKLEIGTRPAVLFLGRRDSGKGYPSLLDAWPLVLQQCPDAVLLLAGPGEADEARLAQFPAENVRDLGCPSEQEKADAYAACDVFCLPSAHESFGIVYVEAWSYGKPVLCGTSPASRELVEHGVTGVWADQQPQQLAAGLLRLLMHPDECRRMGQAGLAQQQRHYTTAQTVACHLKAWNQSQSYPTLEAATSHLLA